MANFSKADYDEAQKFVNFYRYLLEDEHQHIKHYFSSNIILDWFGKTVRGENDTINFLKDNIPKITHYLYEVKPMNDIGFRDTHKIIIRDEPPLLDEMMNVIDSNRYTTPQFSNLIEMGQCDGYHNCDFLVSNPFILPPKKKQKFDNEHNVGKLDNNRNKLNDKKVNYVTGIGIIEFCQKSQKKYQTVTKWKRPFKLHIGYVKNSDNDYSIYLVIYEGNSNCRRNLLKEFNNDNNFN